VLGAPLRTASMTYLLCSRLLPQATIMSTPASSAALAVHSSNAVVKTIHRLPLKAMRSATVNFLCLCMCKGDETGKVGAWWLMASMKRANSSSLMLMLCLAAG